MKQYKFWGQLKDNMQQINLISQNIIPFKIVPCCISTKIPMMFLLHHPHHSISEYNLQKYGCLLQ